MVRSLFFANKRRWYQKRLANSNVQKRGDLQVPRPSGGVFSSNNIRVSGKVLSSRDQTPIEPETEERRVARGGLDYLPNLSRKEGGLANVKSYCRYYLKRPMCLWIMCICSGGGIRPPCVDLFWCLNKPFSLKDPDSFEEGEEDI